MTKIWSYNPITGMWKVEREVSQSEADRWLAVFTQQEPNGVFKVSKTKPKGKLRGLGESMERHTVHADRATGQAISAANRSIKAVRRGDCGLALEALLTAETLFGEAQAHVSSGGTPIHPSQLYKSVQVAEKAYKKKCLRK